MSRMKKYNKGVLLVEVETLKSEKLLNYLWKKDIKLRRIKRNSLTNYTMEIEFKDYNTLLEGVKKVDGKVKVLNRDGIMFTILKLKRRRSLIITLVIFIGVIYYLSSFIWSIDVVTENYIPPFEIREMLKKYGIEKGVNKNSFDVYRLQERIIDDNDEVMWVKARVEGCKLKVEIVERQAPPKIKEPEVTGNVIASKNGEVQRIFSKSGTVLVERGQVVKEGDVLIKGEQGKEGKEYITNAEGAVIAKTFYEVKKEVPKLNIEKKRTGKIAKSYYIDIKGKRIYLKNALNTFEKYDKIEDNKGIIKTEIYHEVLEEEKATNIDDIVEEMKRSILLNLNKSVNVLDVKKDIKEQGDKVLIEVVIIAEEDISKNQTITDENDIDIGKEETINNEQQEN